MRSGFLNVSSSEVPASSSGSILQDKGSRNKRKFRTDQQASLPFWPALSFDDVHTIQSVNDAAVECLPFNAVSTGSLSVENGGCHDHFSSQSSMPSGKTHLPQYGMPAAADCFNAFHHYTYSRIEPGYISTWLPDWDQYTEVQLEQILISMLHLIYKDTMSQITSCGYSQEEALNALLRNDRWNGIDALTIIVENSIAWLRSRESIGVDVDITFSNLKEMESYVLTEMICMLRKVRPFLSKGDAMWYLLMCDMNVILACTVDGDAIHSFLKDATLPVVPQSKIFSRPSLLTGTVNGIPLPQQTRLFTQNGSQSLNPLVRSHKDNCSAFSASSFSPSPSGKVAVASRKGAGKSAVAKIGHWPHERKNFESQERGMLQTFNNVNIDQAMRSMLPLSEEQTTKLGQFMPKFTNHEVVENRKPECPLNSNEPCASTMHVGSMHCMAQCFGSPIQSTVANTPSLQPDFATDVLRQGSNFQSSAQFSLSTNGKHFLDTDLQIGNPTVSRRSQIGEVWMQSNVSANVTSAAIGSSSSGVELSLAATPPDSGGDHCYGNNKEESPVNVFKAPDDVIQMLGYVDSENEEGKTDYLWELADHVKALESQIQCWTDWAQQKVMQAARRLSKDSTELKALRQEREEYIQLKKEKQGLEESTKKKLAEVEVSLRKALSQVERANSTAWRLDNENAKARAEMEAAKLMAAESVNVCQEAIKREKKSIKNVQGWEKQKLKLQEELAGEKQKLSGCLEQLAQARERQQQAEARWRQEKAGKEEALTLFDSEKKAKEDAEHSAKRRVVALQRKSETESVSYGEEIQKLESEIARVKLSLGIQPPIMKWGSGFGNNLDICSAEKLQQMNACLLSEIAELRNSKNEAHQDGDCVMCMNEEMSILFLPCAHEVLCVKCNEAHQTQGLKECPFCRAVVHQRIHVYGVRS